jgi:hypothetical protein
MFDPQMPTPDHAQFDDLCQGVEEYETLPELHPSPTHGTGPADPGAAADTDAIDAEILAGLVTP